MVSRTLVAGCSSRNPGCLGTLRGWGSHSHRRHSATLSLLPSTPPGRSAAGATSCSATNDPPSRQRGCGRPAQGAPPSPCSACAQEEETLSFCMETFSVKGHITGSVAIFQPTSSSLHFPIVFLPVAFSPFPSLPRRTGAGIPRRGSLTHRQGCQGGGHALTYR